MNICCELKHVKQSPYPVYQEINKRITYMGTVDDCPRTIIQDNASDLVCITDTSPVLYVVRRNCSKIYIIPETFNTASMGFTIQKDSAFTPMLNYYLTRLMQNGNIDKWVDKYSSTSDPNIEVCDKSSTQDSAPSIGIEGILGVYICTGVIILIAFFCLTVELVWVHVMKQPVHSLICQS